MFSLAVCENDDYSAKKLVNCVEFYFVNNPSPHRIDRYSCGEHFLSVMKNKSYDIVFFTVSKSSNDGIASARKLREIDKKVAIIFVSDSLEEVLKSFEVAPANFLLKPVVYEKLSDAMDIYMTKLRKARPECFSFSYANTIYRVPLDEIVYFESQLRVLVIKTTEREYRFYGKLAAVEKALIDSRFVRCHQSYIVNMSYITQIDNKNIVTTTGEKINISRSKTQIIRSKFVDYVGDIL